MNGRSERLSRISDALLTAERTLALVESLSPLNFESEVLRLLGLFQKGEVEAPAFVYGPRSDREERAHAAEALLSRAREALCDEAFRREISEGLALVLLDRLGEIETETRMLRACAGEGMRDLSRERFRIDEWEIPEARRLAAAWLVQAPDPDTDPRYPLGAQLAKLRDKLDTGAFVHIVEKPICALSAVGGQTLYVQTGAEVSEREARRIWVHEVEGHLLPRIRAKKAPVPFALGTLGSNVDEEGRAILIEERNGLLSSARQRELAIRYSIAEAFQSGGAEASLSTCRSILDLGASPEVVVRSLCRATRGGGLCREAAYLAGYVRVKRAFFEEPRHEAYFERGRASVQALPFFLRAFPLG